MSTIGILNIDKPIGYSSRDVVNRVERLVRPAKAGHAGTLDPLATGVLVICVGQATRLIEHVQRMRKHYRATFLLGRRSATEDVEGEVTLLEDAPVPSPQAIDSILPHFLGEIQQRPPSHSAIKVAGRRAYELARRGAALELAERTVHIHTLRMERYEYPELQLDIECGSGTYVRALGRDVAAALGTAAVMSALERTAIGGFHVEDAVPIDALTAETLSRHLQPPLTAVGDLPRVTLNESDLAEIGFGRPVSLPSSGSPSASKQEWAAVNGAGELVAVLREKRAGQLWPVCNFKP